MMNFGNGRTYIVAEIGGNFTDWDTGKRLIQEAKNCGVDAVKLQTYRADTLVSEEAMFDMENTGVVSQKDYFLRFEIGEEIHRQAFAYAREVGLDIFSTPSHITDVEMLEKFSPDVYKIGADDLTNLPFLREVAQLQKPIFLSTGMGTLSEIREAVEAILSTGNSKIVIMHVVSLYPTGPEFVNLKAIKTLQREFPEFVVGYSDHTLGIDSCIFAAVMGAKVIEKHFTYDKNADGPDHILSATPDEMSRLVEKIRLFEKMRGDGIKRPMGDEVKNRRNNRKSLVCLRKIKRGDILTDECVGIKRPGTGILPEYKELIIGRRAKRNIAADSLVSWSDFE